jgi:diguanylate cyclase (GGDEF)-like protein/PAS domain S-box-containing protein
MSNVERIQEPDSAFYKTLLESTKAIPWQIDWKSMCFTYVGPQIEELLGWTPESWVNANDWAMRMHDEDRDFVVNFCVSQSRSGIDHEADYRALTADGNYVWIRDVVHVIRGKDGEVESLVGFMFDISERKKNEQELLRLQGELEKLSYTDGLTGIANRRMFEMVLEREWASACRNQRPLSLILLDIDFFKQFNDCYGHQDGDDALKRVASLLTEACRSQDLVARYGGEEFAVILPEADLAAARVVAERCHTLILDENIPHAPSSVSDYLTVSQGLGTIVPNEQDMPQTFIKVVDELLYKAKKQGRNAIGLI